MQFYGCADRRGVESVTGTDDVLSAEWWSLSLTGWSLSQATGANPAGHAAMETGRAQGNGLHHLTVHTIKTLPSRLSCSNLSPTLFQGVDEEMPLSPFFFHQSSSMQKRTQYGLPPFVVAHNTGRKHGLVCFLLVPVYRISQHRPETGFFSCVQDITTQAGNTV